MGRFFLLQTDWNTSLKVNIIPVKSEQVFMVYGHDVPVSLESNLLYEVIELRKSNHGGFQTTARTLAPGSYPALRNIFKFYKYIHLWNSMSKLLQEIKLADSLLKGICSLPE
ncbi:hypothetical protein D3C81_1350330 [compost metagenome]